MSSFVNQSGKSKSIPWQKVVKTCVKFDGYQNTSEGKNKTWLEAGEMPQFTILG
jgi:hypothetical protein